MRPGGPVSKELEAKAAYEIEAKIKVTLQEMKRAWVYLAEDLYNFQYHSHWIALGYPSLDEWLAGPDIDLKRRQAYYLIATYKEMVIEHGATPAMLENVGVTRAKIVLPALRKKKIDLISALSDAETLGRRDLAERYRALAGEGDEGGTHYDADAEPARSQCEVCGSWVTTRAPG